METTETKKRASYEETMFAEWCQAAQDHGLIEQWTEQPITWVLLESQTITIPRKLKTKTKMESKHLYRGLKFTPDSRFKLTKKGRQLLEPIFKYALYTKDYKKSKWVYIDVKGSYVREHSEQKVFSMNRKLVYARFGVWVVKIIPYYSKGGSLFTQTFCPESLRYKQSVTEPTLTKKGEQCQTISEFMKHGANKK